MIKGSGARSSVRIVVPTDDRRLDITKILGSGARSSDTSTVEIEAVSSSMVLNLLLKLLGRSRDLSDGTEDTDSALEVVLKDDDDSESMEHTDELNERFRMAGAVIIEELRSSVSSVAGFMTSVLAGGTSITLVESITILVESSDGSGDSML